MSRGRRYNEEQHLNYTKVFAVIIAIVAVAGVGLIGFVNYNK